MSDPYYNEHEHTDECACGAENSIARRRDYEEKQYLTLEEGCATVDGDDLDVVGEWVYYCMSCGDEGADLDDLLGWKEGDDDDD